MLLAEAQGLSSVCPGSDNRDGDDEQHGKVFTPSMSWHGGSGGGSGGPEAESQGLPGGEGEPRCQNTFTASLSE